MGGSSLYPEKKELFRNVRAVSYRKALPPVTIQQERKAAIMAPV